MADTKSKPPTQEDTSVEHYETPTMELDKVNTFDPSHVINNVEYGPTGTRGLLTAPPVIILTSVLASLGGFSFGCKSR